MKKYAYLFLLITLCASLSRCSIKRQMQKDMDAVFSITSYSIAAADQEKAKETYLRGFHLYKQNCSDCHGTSSTGKDTIPEFTMFQLDNYADAANKGDPENHAVLKKLSPEQTSDILSFLLYQTLAKQARRAESAKKTISF